MHTPRPTSRNLLALMALGALCLATSPAYAQAGRRVSFSKDILPLLQRRCTICHGAEERGGLKLDSFENLMIGGKSGQVIQARNPNTSRLMQLVEGRAQPRMPVGGRPLEPSELFMLRAWILQGAEDDSDADSPRPASSPLTLLTPRDGSVVRETVRLSIPRASVPPDGFVAVYINGRFRVALAAPPAEGERAARAPVTYDWDTKAPLTLDTTVQESERFVKDGPQVIEVRSYRSDGTIAETVKAQVVLQNRIEANTTQPVLLSYAQPTSAVGRTYELEHTVDVDANPGETAPRRAGVSSAGSGRLTHVETSTNLVSLEDVENASGTAFWRERRESPLTVAVNGLKQIVRFETSSRYFSLTRQGLAIVSRQMEREQRDPLINPIDLPGRPVRLNETFNTNVRINLGAYIPGSLRVSGIEARLEAMEWQHGEPCVRIKMNYLGGRGRVDIPTWNVTGAELDIQRGSTTVWFSQRTNRVLRAQHEVEGSIEVPVDASAGQGAFAGGPGGEAGPGLMAGGAPGGGAPGVFAGGPGAGGAPGVFAGGPSGGAPGVFAGGPSGSAGRRPGGRTPAGSGAPGGIPYGAMMSGGAPGGIPYGMMAGAPGGGLPLAGTSSGAPPIVETTRRYHVMLKVSTDLKKSQVALNR
jgi:hypothetical protein